MRLIAPMTGLALIVAVSACVQDDTPPAGARLAYTPPQKGTAVLSGGAGYHGAYLKEVAPENAQPSTEQPAEPGKLPLPTQYPLLPGDAELWATLTREQQERALQFLRDGSTIRASLEVD
ncbi:hypothetical protein LV82_00068 [Albidovulum inexpectatum]|uniref:Beta-barrel assembly complex subunit BamF n=1 Tax=Albidovulum inexpectatum TaxID=196587 RepID=A0A2S5JKW2_9RHOB|nr:hypothetical protein [Albidovulum inexpectatum]PPB82146.1 hypothetical protein LV82_00068 [Albidovulum inexpectatum]